MPQERFNQQEVADLNDHLGANRYSLMGKLTEEIGELFDAERFSPQMYGEIVDLIIVCVGVMAQGGFDTGLEVDKKLALTREKYKDLPALRKSGLNHPQAVEFIKRSWKP